MSIVRTILFAGSLFLLPAALPAAPATNPAPAAAAIPYLPSVAELVSLIQSNGIAEAAGSASEEHRRELLQSVARVFDPGAEVMDADAWETRQQRRQGRVRTIDAALALSNHVFTVTNPGNSGALQAGDRLIAVDGESVESWDLTRLLHTLRADPAGPPRLALTLQRGETVLTTSVDRVTRDLPLTAAAESWPSDLFYMRLNGLYADREDEDPAAALREGAAQAEAGVILDLRGADGVDLDRAAELAGCFADPHGFLFAFRDRAGQDLAVYHAPEDARRLEVPAMVLIDRHTSGAAEVLAAALKNSLRGAMLIGTVTAGDMEVRRPLELDAGRVAYLAVRRLDLADGSSFTGHTGIRPNIQITRLRTPPPPAGGNEEEPDPDTLLPEEREDRQLARRVAGDPALRRAADILLGLNALDIKALGN